MQTDLKKLKSIIAKAIGKEKEIYLLADVLIASKSVMSKNNDCTVFEEQIENLVMNWNLKDNNLDNQSDETKQFLIDLLV